MLSEIWRGKFQRSFTVPVEVDAGKADASYENGLLILTGIPSPAALHHLCNHSSLEGNPLLHHLKFGCHQS